MKKSIITTFLVLSICSTYAQTSTLNDPDVKATVQKIKDNIDNLSKAFKGEKEPSLAPGLRDTYYTNIKLFNVRGSLDDNNFDENMSFRISNADHKKATRAEFDKAFAELTTALKTSFPDLEVSEKQNERTKELKLFEKGKDINAPVSDDGSPKYFISLKYTEEITGFYSFFLFITSKKIK